jgi:hypothetical protein
MGNWRTVNLRGTLATEDVAAVREFIAVPADYSRFHCLSATNGLAGLGQWATEEIHADGNLAERDYGPEDVADTLREIVAFAPSLTLKVHCGNDYEDKTCVATVTVADGVVSVGDPERETVGSISEDAFAGRLFRAITGFGAEQPAPSAEPVGFPDDGHPF